MGGRRRVGYLRWASSSSRCSWSWVLEALKGLMGAAEASAWSPSEGELVSPWRPAEPADVSVVPSGTGRNQQQPGGTRGGALLD